MREIPRFNSPFSFTTNLRQCYGIDILRASIPSRLRRLKLQKVKKPE